MRLFGAREGRQALPFLAALMLGTGAVAIGNGHAAPAAASSGLLDEVRAQAILAELSGVSAKHAVTRLTAFHRTPASSGFHEAVEFLQAELTRLGVAMGGDPLTFSGLAGMGDLFATCMSPFSRNQHVGVELGKGRKIDEIIAEMNMVAEGVKTSKVVGELAQKVGIELPIAQQVEAVCHHGVSVADALASLMQRPSGHELDGIR